MSTGNDTPDHDDESSPGWDAIDAALARLYPGVQPLHWGTMVPWSLGGKDPLDGISAYPRTDPVPHWHLVSYGMTELHEKTSDNPEESGWGFELTFRVARRPDEETPPMWALSFLQNLGRYVYTTGNWFDAGHTMNVNGPIAASRDDSAIRAIAFTEDPELGAIDTPHGRVVFLQVVGLALDEYEACREWNAASMLELLQPHIPLYLTDVDRDTLLDDPRIAADAYAGIQRDGSSTGALYVGVASWQRENGTGVLRVGALQAPAVAQGLRGRLPFGNELIVESDEGSVRFEPAERLTVDDSASGVVVLGIPTTALEELAAALRPQRGRTSVPSLPGLVVEVIPTAMRDADGNETGEVIG